MQKREAVVYWIRPAAKAGRKGFKRMKQLLKNAKIYDGTGADAYMGDILIEGDRIARVGASIDEAADRVIDLAGKSVASGFIDGHSHNDWFAIKKEPLPYFEPFIRQGITTFVTGNCGLSTVGFEPGCRYVDKLGGGLFGPAGFAAFHRLVVPFASGRQGRGDEPEHQVAHPVQFGRYAVIRKIAHGVHQPAKFRFGQFLHGVVITFVKNEAVSHGGPS